MAEGSTKGFGLGNTVTALAIIALVGGAIWLTHSLWALLGLIFLAAAAPQCRCDTYPDKCPMCKHKLVPDRHQDDEDEDD